MKIRDKIKNDEELTDEGKRRQLARIVRDSQVALSKVTKQRETLTSELADAQASFKPTVEPNDTVAASIWDKLPEDPLEVERIYHAALDRSDYHTANAIESMPSVFEGVISPDRLAELKRDRIAVEAPDTARAIETAEQNLALVSLAESATGQYLDEAARELPDPDANEQHEVGADGLTILSPSQFEEAMHVE